MPLLQPRSTLFPYTTLFRSGANLNFSLKALGIHGVLEPIEYNLRIRRKAPRRHATTDTQRRSRAQFRSAHFKQLDRKSTRLNSSHGYISYAVFCLKKKI